jgi:Nitroreductase family
MIEDMTPAALQPLDFEDKPSGFPNVQVGGGPQKPITQVLLDRRATAHFRPDPVPDNFLEAILRLGARAPSGYNLQPWRFKGYGGRLALKEFVDEECFGRPWGGSGNHK